MNKIYKVIWSKVKNQYVVVSELAHSNGKQSRTSRNSIRSRIAALVVCGAIAAFGAFGALPIDSAYAAENYEYIAFQDDGTLGNKDSDTISLGPDGEYTYVRTKVIDPTKKEGDIGRTQTFWVREGFSIELVENVRFDQNDVENAKTDTVIVSHKSEGANEKGLILSYQNVDNDMHVNTLNGDKLLSSETGMYGGGVNTESTAVTSTSDFVLRKENGDYTNIRVNTEDGTFVTLDSNNGLKYENNKYYFKGEAVDNKNLYVLDYNGQKKIGVFTLGDKLYTGSVYGRNNEILMTGINSQNKLDSYWGTEIDDPEMSISQMTMGDLDERFDKIKKDIVDIHKDDIKEIQVTPANTDDITKGGTIRLQTNGEFDSDGNPTGGVNVPGTITIRNTDNSGINGNDVKIRFGSIAEDETDVEKFTVDAGSKVVGQVTKNGSEQDAGVGDANKTLTGIKINGVEYDLSQGKTYSNGNGISIDEENNKISVNAGDGLTFGTEQTNDKGKLKVNVGDGLSIKDGQVINNLKVTADTNATKNNKNGGNWTVTDSKANITLTNTTLSSSVDKQPITGENVAGSGYGNTYTISDTDGNTATLSDVASAATLKNIDVNKIGNLKYGNTTNIVTNNTTVTEAIGDLDNAVSKGWTAQVGDSSINVTPKDGKNTLSFAGDNNITVSADENTSTIQVGLNNDVYLGGNNTAENSNITLDGTNGVIEVGSTIALDGRDGKAVIGSINIETVYDEATGKPSSTISGLANTTWDADLAAQGGYANSNKAATEAQIQSAVNQSGWTASTNKNVEGLAAKTDITNGDTVDFSNTDGNISVSQTAVTENGTVTGTDIKFDLNDNISLGDGKITLNGAPAEGEDLLNVDNKLVVAQDGTTTIAVNDGTVMGNNTTVTIGSDGVTFAGYDKGSTIIDGQTIQAGGVFINDGGNGQITRLTNTTLDDPTFATVGRAATEEQLQLATDAATTTVTEGKNIDVTSTVDKEDGHTNYEVKLQDNVVLGDNKITLNGNPGEGEDLLNVDNALVVGQDGTTTIAADNAETMGVDTRVTVNTDGVTFEGLENGSTIIDGQTIQAGGVFINDGGNGQITRLTNTTLDDPTFATVGRAATEEQLQLATDAATTTVSEGKNIDVTSTVDEEDGHTDYEVSLQDNVSLGDGKITLNGAPAEGDDLLNVDNAFVVGQDGTTTITADDAGTMGADTKVTVGTDGVKFEGLENGTTTIDGQTIQAGGVFINDGGNGQITRLTNTTLDDPTFATVGRAATEEQLKQAAAASKTTLSDGVNTTVTSNDNTPDGHVDYQVNLNDNVYLGGNNKPGSSNIELDGENGTIQVGSNIILDSKEARAIIGGVDISTTFDDIGKKSSTITGLSNTTWDTDKVVIDRAATEGQLQMVSDKVTAGWTATDDAGNKINVNPETRPTLNFASGKNITVSANEDSGEVEVSLNDNINLNDRVYINGDPEEGNNTIVDIKSGNTSKEESIFAVEDKGNGSISIGGIDITNVDGPYLAVGDGKLKFYKDGGLSTGNATGTFSVRPDGDLEISGKNSSFDVDAETGNINAENNSGSSIKMDGNGTTIAVNDGTVMGNNTTMTVNKDGVAFSAYGNGTTVIDGQTIYAGGVVINNNGSGTINGLTNTTWDDELAKQVANSEELQSTAATQGQLQQAVSEVATEAGKHTIVSTPKDSNLTVTNIAKNGEAANYQVTLNDDITLGDKTSTSITLYTDPTSETTVVGTDGNTTNVTGYVPESYKSGTGADFVKNNGGFALFTTDTQGHGIFGVTTKGTAHGKDFVTYTKDIYNNSVQYSLNDVGNIVTQISHAVFDEGFGNTGMEYTLISDFEDEADKDSPFDAKEGKTRTIGLAVRQDGAVIVGAVVNDEGISSDRGIRINAETKTTYDENDNEVTNNIATITGLENTEWKPKAPEQTPQAKMATFAANDGTTTTETSRAATEAQLDDLYSSVVGYNVKDGSIDHTHVTLGGKKTYGLGRAIGDHSGGVVLNNVAYASGTDGSEAVNVDYLNDAINNAVKDGGAISDSDRHLQEGTYHVNDQGKVELIVADEKGENQSTVTIDNIANKNDITNLDNKIDNTFNDLNDKINNIDNVETDVKGGNINEDGTISLKTENEDGTTTNVTLKGQLTDSGVVQEGTSFDKETGTITITSQDKYSGETSSVKVEGIASTEVVGATNKEDLATAYKDADKDGNATTEYITDSESMVEADVALDHAIQDVAGTSYANDMVLSNRIDSVEKRLGNVEERIDKVGAMAAAIANLRTMGFDPEAPTEIAIGVGQYKSETGIAIGVFHYPNQDFMLSASLSSSGDELMGGIGATWKLGRKSAAERAKDEEARHLEQAEEMKKLAQQEKVKAQAQRHAKLLAERQQASQKNA